MRLPPGPSLPPAVQTFLWMARPVPFIEECRRRYGDTVRLRFVQIGDVVFVSSPEAIRATFTAPPEDVCAGAGNDFLRPVLGADSMLLLDGAAHARHRRLLMPPFHGPRLSVYVEIIRELTEASLRTWPTDNEFALRPYVRDIVLGAIFRAVFGLSLREKDAPLASALARYAELGNGTLLFFPQLQHDWGPLSPWGRVIRLRAETDRLLYAEIARRKQNAHHERNDVLSLLLSARDEEGKPLTDGELRDELITLLLAGHETVATALEWALEQLSHAPEALETLGSELRRVVGKAPIEAEHLPKLEYLDAVVKEVFRLRPVVPNVARRLLAPLSLDGYELPKGMGVSPCIYLAHRRADTYPYPTRFDPSRWIGRKVDPYAWLPFGGGPRRCLGMAFAMLEIKTVLATVLLQRQLCLTEKKSARIGRRGFTLSPRGFRPVIRLAQA